MALFSPFTNSLKIRLVALLLSVTSLIALCAINHLLPKGPSYVDALATSFKALPLTTNSFSILACGIVLCVGLLSKRASMRPSPIHPVISIVADFLGWGVNWAMGILILMFKQELGYIGWLCSDSYSLPATGADERGGCARARTVDGVEIMVGIIGILVGIIHMSFFFKGWSDAHEHRSNAHHRGKVVELSRIEEA